LPCQIRSRRESDDRAQVGVVHRGQCSFDFDRQLRAFVRGRDRTCDAALRRPIDRRKGPDLKAEALHGDAPLAESDADVLGQQRQLVCPHTRRYAKKQNSVHDGEGNRALGDARTDGLSPSLSSDRRATAGEPILARSVENDLEGLG
jgi:hypothetical protein